MVTGLFNIWTISTHGAWCSISTHGAWIVLYLHMVPGLFYIYTYLHYCITDVRAWLLHNDLMLNSDKTEAIVISAVNTRAHATVDVVIDVCGCVVTPAPYVRDIGVWFDSTMSMAKNVSRVCQIAYCQLRSIARIRRSITTAACRTIVHALVMSRLDYCNDLLYGLPDAQLQKLQLVQNSAA